MSEQSTARCRLCNESIIGAEIYEYNFGKKNATTLNIFLCPNDLHMLVLNSSKMEALLLSPIISSDTAKSKAPEGTCFFCKSKNIAASLHDFKFDKKRTTVLWRVCQKHLDKTVKRHLTPGNVKAMRESSKGETFLTHEDFYTENGESVQPI